MATAREKIAEICENEPDESPYEESPKELAFARMVERGLEDSKAGSIMSNEEMGRRVRSWEY